MGPSMEDSNIAFIQPYVSKNRVGYVSFARVFFFCQTTIATATKTSKGKGFHQQNNNSARESRFSVNLFAVSAQLRLEMTKF